LYGLLNFNVEYWNGSSWVTVPGGSVTGNNKVWRKFTFSPITTSKIRVYITAVPDAWSRVVEIQAFGISANDQKVQWLISDHLGTPRMILDQTGSLANMKRHDYLPFGEELFAPTSGRSAAQGYAGGDGVRQQFTQKERDVETGLDYFDARYFAATQGRFTSVDPLLESADPLMPQSWNRYSYVLNNPLVYTDPTGEIWVRSGETVIWFSQERWDNEISKLQDANGNAVYTPLEPSEMEFNTVYGRVRLNPNGPDPEAERGSDAYLGFSIVGENKTDFSVAMAAGLAIGVRGRTPILIAGAATLATVWILTSPVQQHLPLVDPNIYARKRDLELIDYIADKYGIDRETLSEEVHERKRTSGRGGKDNLGKEVIEKIAKEIKETFGSKKTPKKDK
jgi:RHS repeat-associated protein